MTATEQLIAKQVSDVFPASVDDLPLADAARRGLIAPLRCLRVPPAAAINSVPIVGGDFEERALAAALDHAALNQAAASLYRDRFGTTPGIVYAAGVEHAYNLAQEFRAAGIKAEAVSGKTPPVKLAETLAAYERGEINVLINAQLLAEGWNSPRATVCFHLAPTASRRVYQQRIGRIMRMHPRKEAGIVVDFVTEGRRRTTTASSRCTRCSTPTSTARAPASPPAPRRRQQRRARRQLSPAPWLVPVTPDVARRLAVIQREWQRVDPKFLDDEEQRFWATIAGRHIRFDQRADFARKFTEGGAGKGALETFLSVCAAENPNRRLRMTALADRVSTPVERADFDDLVTLVSQAPPWEKDRAARRAHPAPRDRRGEGERAGPDPRPLDVAARAGDAQGAGPARERASSPRRSGCSARSPTRAATGTRRTSRSSCRSRGRCRSPSAPRCSRPPRATRRARTRCSTRPARTLGPIHEIANALAENLPAPKTPARKSRRAAQEAPRRPERRRRAADGAGRGRSANAEAPATRPRQPIAGTPAETRGEPDGRLDEPRTSRSATRLQPDAAVSGAYCSRGGSSSSSSRSRRKRVSSAASDSPDGRSPRRRLLERVGALLELLDVRRRLGVGRDRLADLLARTTRSASSSSPSVDRDRRAASPSRSHSALRRARARRQRDVVRHRRPQAHRRHARRAAGVVEHADDAGRPLVARGREPELLDERRRRSPLPVTGAGRVCGTSASSAPSVTTSSTPSSRARPTTSSPNVRQR